MTPRFVDTNIFLRHLLNDDPQRSLACFRLIQAIEQGHAAAWTTPLVIAEVVFVLSNKKTYGKSREFLRDHLLPLINLQGLKIEHKRLYERVFDLYMSHPISYIDAFHAALVEHEPIAELYSYDTDFDLVPSVQRIEP